MNFQRNTQEMAQSGQVNAQPTRFRHFRQTKKFTCGALIANSFPMKRVCRTRFVIAHSVRESGQQFFNVLFS